MIDTFETLRDNCEQTINRLLRTLDDQKVVAAIDRLDRRYSMRIVTET